MPNSPAFSAADFQGEVTLDHVIPAAEALADGAECTVCTAGLAFAAACWAALQDTNLSIERRLT